jgi:hypothetical protein
MNNNKHCLNKMVEKIILDICINLLFEDLDPTEFLYNILDNSQAPKSMKQTANSLLATIKNAELL